MLINSPNNALNNVTIMKLSTAALIFVALLGTVAMNPSKASAADIDIRLTNQQNHPSVVNQRFAEQQREQQQRLAQQREQQQRLAQQRAREQQQRLAQQRAHEQQQRLAQQREQQRLAQLRAYALQHRVAQNHW